MKFYCSQHPKVKAVNMLHARDISNSDPVQIRKRVDDNKRKDIQLATSIK